jgi:apolipoprotein D and lipocalin family protein
MKSILLLSLAVLGLAGCATMKPTPDLTTVKAVDLPRYMGRWYVIAYVPNFIEDGKVGTSDRYVLRPDGKMDNIYAFRRKTLEAPEKKWHGTAWVVNSESNAEWKVQLLWPFTSEYKILELDPDYHWAVVASNGGKLLWILSRDPVMADETYADLLSRISKRRLDAAKMVKVAQIL